MAHNIEKVAKETILLFFLETTEQYLGKYDDDEVSLISRWLTKITRLDFYSMRTHLLLLYHVMKRGELQPPFNKDPSTINLPRFRGYTSYIDVDDPNLEQALASITHCWAQASRHSNQQDAESAQPAAVRKSRKDVFHIPCRQPGGQAQRPLPHQHDQGADDINQTFTSRSRSQPRFQGDFDEPAVRDRRSRSVPRSDNQEEAYGQFDEPAVHRQHVAESSKCCPPEYNPPPQTNVCSHTVCRPCLMPPNRQEIGSTSSFYTDDYHLPNFPLSPIRKRAPAARFADENNCNSCSQRSRIPVPKSRYASRTEQRNESRIPVRTSNRFAQSSRLQSGVTVVILSPLRHSASDASPKRRSSVK